MHTGREQEGPSQSDAHVPGTSSGPSRPRREEGCGEGEKGSCPGAERRSGWYVPVQQRRQRDPGRLGWPPPTGRGAARGAPPEFNHDDPFRMLANGLRSPGLQVAAAGAQCRRVPEVAGSRG